jgi:glycosyltransferase involved in cell wall biosynthesis
MPLTAGGGSRLKVLEAFAAGVPVLSSAKGVEGLDVTNGTHYLAAETNEGFADAAAFLLANRSLMAALRSQAFSLVSKEYSIDSLTRRLADSVLTS